MNDRRHPKVKFKTNIKTDTLNCFYFIKRNSSRSNWDFLCQFLPKELRYIIKQKLSDAKIKKVTKDYTEKVYRQKMREMRVGAARAAGDWKNIEKDYYAVVDTIFKNHPWPRGKYIAYSSIFGMFPRNVKEKYFFFPPMHLIPKYANKVTAHEMLHFMFFDYIKKRFGLKEGQCIKDKPDNYIWQVSEVFNNVMENWPPYQKIIGDKGRPYKGTEKIFKKMSAQWRKKQDVDWLLSQWLKSS